MRITLLISLILVAVSLAEGTQNNSTKSSITATPKVTDATTKTPKSTKTPGEARGRRTLYDLGNYPNFVQPHITRRIGGYPDPNSYYSQDHGYQPQIVQYPSYISEPSNHLRQDHHSRYFAHPQYIEAPEPIIEIIIKEANETLDLPQPQPLIQKKKKEKVQVFYVNYKKDKNNKLHLESPIASLEHNSRHNHEEEEEETEEIIQYPVTARPPIKTTTLRTIIHPESEQYHSNSGIHVSFGTEDRHQSGHQLQEHNEESVIRSVVALPNPNNFIPVEPQRPSAQNHHQSIQTLDHRFLGGSQQQQQQQQYKTDLSESRTLNIFGGGNSANHFNKNPYTGPPPPGISPPQALVSDFPPAQHYVSQHLQLPTSHQAEPFRNYINQYQVTHTLNAPQQNKQQQQYNQQAHSQQPQYQQTAQFSQRHQHHSKLRTPSYPPLEVIQPYQPHHQPAQSQPQPQPHSQSPQEQYQQQQQQQQRQHFSINYDHKQQQKEQTVSRPNQYPTKQSIRFPFPLEVQQQQGLPLPQYQPVKFRPTPIPQNKPISAPAHSSHYQQEQPNLSHQQQKPQQSQLPKQYHQQKTQQISQQKPFNPLPIFGQQIYAKTTPQPKNISFGSNDGFNQHQTQLKQQQSKPQAQPTKQILRNPASHAQNEQHHSPNLQGVQPFYGGFVQHSSPDLGPLQSLFGGPTQSELVSSVPKFEQHITEFVRTAAPQQHQQPYQAQQSQLNSNINYNDFSFTNKNQVIQNIPAPKLGPTSPNPFNQHGSTTRQPLTTASRYVISSTPDYNNFAIQQQQQQQQQQQEHQQQKVHPLKYASPTPQYHSTTPQYAQTNDRQQVQIVTPMPNINTDYRGSQKHQQFTSGGAQPLIIPNSQPHHHQQYQIGSEQQYQSDGKSVSTLHTDAFQDLDKKRNEYLDEQKHQQNDHKHEQEYEQYSVQQDQQRHQQNQQDQQRHQQDQQRHQQDQQRHQQNQQEQQRYQQNQQQLQQQQQQPQQQHNSQYQNQQSNQKQYYKSQNYVTIQAKNKYSTGSTSAELIKSNTSPSLATSKTTTPTTPAPQVTNVSNKKSQLDLPDEVPDELRQQLLSSGILDNADISVLDYDKVGDIALENLPPEHLAHFYGNGGGAQVAGSNKILSVVKPNGDRVNLSEKQIRKFKQSQSLPKRQNVDLKVVRFDSTNQKSVTDNYLKNNSTVLPNVNLSSDKQYNRYLPLKVSGAHFPIPDVDELKHKKISSVVILAPVDSLQNIESDIEGRQERDTINSKSVKFIAGDSLKHLIKKPTAENFKKWLDKESKTEIDLQSVVLLVARGTEDEKEIFMYDIGSQSINKLSGELSTAFVNVAEENASSEDLENVQITDSGIVERMSSENTSAEDQNPTATDFNNNSQKSLKFSVSGGYSAQ